MFDQFLQLVEARQRHSSAPLTYCFYMGASTLPPTEIGLGFLVLALCCVQTCTTCTAVLGKRRKYCGVRKLAKFPQRVRHQNVSLVPPLSMLRLTGVLTTLTGGQPTDPERILMYLFDDYRLKLASFWHTPCFVTYKGIRRSAVLEGAAYAGTTNAIKAIDKSRLIVV